MPPVARVVAVVLRRPPPCRRPAAAGGGQQLLVLVLVRVALGRPYYRSGRSRVGGSFVFMIIHRTLPESAKRKTPWDAHTHTLTPYARPQPRFLIRDYFKIVATPPVL